MDFTTSTIDDAIHYLDETQRFNVNRQHYENVEWMLYFSVTNLLIIQSIKELYPEIAYRCDEIRDKIQSTIDIILPTYEPCPYELAKYKLIMNYLHAKENTTVLL